MGHPKIGLTIPCAKMLGLSNHLSMLEIMFVACDVSAFLYYLSMHDFKQWIEPSRRVEVGGRMTITMFDVPFVGIVCPKHALYV